MAVGDLSKEVPLVQLSYGRSTFLECSSTIDIYAYDVQKKGISRRRPAELLEILSPARTTLACKLGTQLFGMFQAIGLKSDENVILSISCINSSYSTVTHRGQLFIRLRATGPAYAIGAKIVSHENSAIPGPLLVFQGRGDILSAKEARDLGIEISEIREKNFCSDKSVEDIFNIVSVANEHVQKPTKIWVKQGAGDKEIPISTVKRAVKPRNATRG